MTNELRNVTSRLGLGSPFRALAIGAQFSAGRGAPITVASPIDGSTFGDLGAASPDDVERVVDAARQAFETWRLVPAPVRGELVRRIADELRRQKHDLASLVSWEVGKITEEALGEVQEMIDICDFAVGLSRGLSGLTIPSERRAHRLMEQWHPLGPIGVITAFNFPVAVWAWNAALALICGDPVVWKPSEKAPLCALACHAIAQRAIEGFDQAPSALLSLVIGRADVGEALAANASLPLISATGSVSMGRAVARSVASRLGRSLLELGGNNAAIIAPSADLELACRAAVFSAVGTAGQRCTTLRRLIVHRSLYPSFVARLRAAYERLTIGDPRQSGVLVGPLIDEDAALAMASALHLAREQGGTVTGGERLRDNVPKGGVYVKPAIVEIAPSAPILQNEVFAPIVYLMPYDDLTEAIAYQNGVPQGLASAIFSNDVRETELFCSASGSDCGIANVNIGTSGAEIGGAFGGEKDTGGGRESGSDAWKNYMRRATNTVNYSRELPLAQGIRFDV